jgi:hypothetical protein
MLNQASMDRTTGVGGVPVDEVEQGAATTDSAGARRHGPDSLVPTEAAELYIVVLPGNRPGGRADVADSGPLGSSVSPEPPSLRRFGPGVQVGVKVPGSQAGQLLRVFERVVPLAVWQISVIGSLFGAAAAHLPPAGTTAVVVLEIVVPPLLLRRRTREKNK